MQREVLLCMCCLTSSISACSFLCNMNMMRWDWTIARMSRRRETTHAFFRTRNIGLSISDPGLVNRHKSRPRKVSIRSLFTDIWLKISPRFCDLLMSANMSMRVASLVTASLDGSDDISIETIFNCLLLKTDSLSEPNDTTSPTAIDIRRFGLSDFFAKSLNVSCRVDVDDLTDSISLWLDVPSSSDFPSDFASPLSWFCLVKTFVISNMYCWKVIEISLT